MITNDAESRTLSSLLGLNGPHGLAHGPPDHVPNTSQRSFQVNFENRSFVDLTSNFPSMFQDMTSPLSKILHRQRNRGPVGGEHLGLGGFGSLSSPPVHDYRSVSFASDGSNFPKSSFASDGLSSFSRGSQSSCDGSGGGSPTFLDDPPSLLPPTAGGGQSKFNFARSESPDSDAGYGTSYGSYLSGGSSKGPKMLANEDKELGGLLVNLEDTA